MNDLREALESMVYQYGYQVTINKKPAIIAGGMSALESAFSALGWDDPHFINEEGNTCEVAGCLHPISSGTNWGKYYLMLCHKHASMSFKKKRRPKVKQYAIERELTRDKITGFLPSVKQ
jgi:hypothetical protein